MYTKKKCWKFGLFFNTTTDRMDTEFSLNERPKRDEKQSPLIKPSHFPNIWDLMV